LMKAMIGKGITVVDGAVSLGSDEAAALGSVKTITILTMLVVMNGESTIFKLILLIVRTLSRRDVTDDLYYTKTLVPDTIADVKKQGI
jgi:hypothetical protein